MLIKQLLGTAAVLSFVAAGAMAQTAPETTPADPAAQAADSAADAAGAAAVAADVAARLDLVAEEYERGWTGRPTQDGGRIHALLTGTEPDDD